MTTSVIVNPAMFTGTGLSFLVELPNDSSRNVRRDVLNWIWALLRSASEWNLTVDSPQPPHPTLHHKEIAGFLRYVLPRRDLDDSDFHWISGAAYGAQLLSRERGDGALTPELRVAYSDSRLPVPVRCSILAGWASVTEHAAPVLAVLRSMPAEIPEDVALLTACRLIGAGGPAAEIEWLEDFVLTFGSTEIAGDSWNLKRYVAWQALSRSQRPMIGDSFANALGGSVSHLRARFGKLAVKPLIELFLPKRAPAKSPLMRTLKRLRESILDERGDLQHVPGGSANWNGSDLGQLLTWLESRT